MNARRRGRENRDTVPVFSCLLYTLLFPFSTITIVIYITLCRCLTPYAPFLLPLIRQNCTLAPNAIPPLPRLHYYYYYYCATTSRACIAAPPPQQAHSSPSQAHPYKAPQLIFFFFFIFSVTLFFHEWCGPLW